MIILGHPISKWTTVLLSLGYAQQYVSELHGATTDRFDGTRNENSQQNDRKYG